MEGQAGGKLPHTVVVIIIGPACHGQCTRLIVPSGLHGGSVARTVDFDGNGSFLFMHGYSYVCSLVQSLKSLVYKLHTSSVQVLYKFRCIRVVEKQILLAS